MRNRISVGTISKFLWILLMWIAFLESPQASLVANGKSDVEDPSGATIAAQEAKESPRAKKPGKVTIVYTGDLQGNLGPCG